MNRFLHYGWPFFEPRHAKLASEADAWAKDNLGHAHGDDADAICRRLVRDLGCDVVYGTGAPSLVSVYRRAGFDQRRANALGRVTRRTLPGIGTGACVIGRRPSSSMAV